MREYTGLKSLQTPLGVRSLEESVAYCNRCGMCAAVCPVYQLDPQESNSPRGRNQTLRFLLEGKLQAKQARGALEKLARSCVLCGQCTRFCPGKIPTAQHMLELRRRLHIRVLPRTLQGLLRMRQTFPKIFSILLKMGLWGKRVGVLPFMGGMPGFGWVHRVNEWLPQKPGCPFAALSVTKPTLIYVPSLEAQFLCPDISQQTYTFACKKRKVTVWSNTSSGLFEYVYGDTRRAQKILRKLITRHAHTGNGKLPVLTDSINVYLFWKQAPQFFEGFSTWQASARHFAACVQFVVDYLPRKPRRNISVTQPVLWMPSSPFSWEDKVFEQAVQILHTHFKKNFVQCGYKQAGVPPLGYGLMREADSRLFVQAVCAVASHQAQRVFVLDGLTALELEASLRRFYPTARACHIVQLG